MNATAEIVLDKLEQAHIQNHNATMATIQFCRTLLTDSKNRAADDDDWLRLPSPVARCPISGWSRSSVNRRIADGDVRKKKIEGMAYYSGADVRKYLAATPDASTAAAPVG